MKFYYCIVLWSTQWWNTRLRIEGIRVLGQISSLYIVSDNDIFSHTQISSALGALYLANYTKLIEPSWNVVSMNFHQWLLNLFCYYNFPILKETH